MDAETGGRNPHGTMCCWARWRPRLRRVAVAVVEAQVIESAGSLDKKITPKYKESKWKTEDYTEKVQEKLRALGYIQ